MILKKPEETRTNSAKRARGVFQWVILVTKHIRYLTGEPKNRILKEISRLPSELVDLYEDMLGQVPVSDLQLLIRVMRWTKFSYKRLTIEQLRFAIAADPDRSLRSLRDLESSACWFSDDDDML